MAGKLGSTSNTGSTGAPASGPARRHSSRTPAPKAVTAITPATSPSSLACPYRHILPRMHLHGCLRHRAPRIPQFCSGRQASSAAAWRLELRSCRPKLRHCTDGPNLPPKSAFRPEADAECCSTHRLTANVICRKAKGAHPCARRSRVRCRGRRHSRRQRGLFDTHFTSVGSGSGKFRRTGSVPEDAVGRARPARHLDRRNGHALAAAAPIREPGVLHRGAARRNR